MASQPSKSESLLCTMSCRLAERSNTGVAFSSASTRTGNRSPPSPPRQKQPATAPSYVCARVHVTPHMCALVCVGVCARLRVCRRACPRAAVELRTCREPTKHHSSTCCNGGMCAHHHAHILAKEQQACSHTNKCASAHTIIARMSGVK